MLCTAVHCRLLALGDGRRYFSFFKISLNCGSDTVPTKLLGTPPPLFLVHSYGTTCPKKMQ